MRTEPLRQEIVIHAGACLLLSSLLAGCAGGRGPGHAGTGHPPPARDAVAASVDGEPAYLRLQPERTGLQAVHDDGRITYLTFAAAPAPETGFFDQDGRGLAAARIGRVVAVAGIHRGILVRADAERASFVSPNPRRPAGAPALPPDGAEYVEARAALESQPVLQQAMQQALAAVAPAAASGGAAAVRPATARPPPAAEPRPAERFAAAVPLAPVAHLGRAARPADEPRGSLPEVTYLDGAGGGSRLAAVSRWRSDAGPVAAAAAPLAAAHASVAVPAHGLVRVFFATASRTIVAPDDGLGLLLREAPNADEIRVTGFTDATGSREANDALARARADAVVQILMRRGVAPDRILSGGIGAADYIADNASERGRALNRRVEVVLLREGRPLVFGGL